jgi:glycosyltransferase involved in cell wall biosynthesis
MSQIEKYLNRQQISLLPIMEEAIADGIFVVIPAYNETETLYKTLDCLYSINRSGLKVNVVIVVNCGLNDSFETIETSKVHYQWCSDYAQNVNDDSFRILPIGIFDFHPKEKGAGLARKTGMDQVAAFCFSKSISDTVILSLDADSVVADNYFVEIQKYFSFSRNIACSIYFEHPIIGHEFALNVYDGIVLYELHLRYYIQSLKAAGFTFAFHTVGSCMAFKLSAYVKAGGMTKKQAGEDFYMIHKLVLQGGFSELNSTCVYPSPRPSNRVVFGTGATISKWLKSNSYEYLTYNLQSFIDLKSFFDIKDQLFKAEFETYQSLILKLSGRIRSYLNESKFWNDLQNVNQNCSHSDVFLKRFFEIFNAFRIIQYLNFVHEHYLQKTEVNEAASALLMMNDCFDNNVFLMSTDLLEKYRLIDRNGPALKIS